MHPKDASEPDPHAMRAGDGLSIALVAPPMFRVPPPTYAGTERVAAAFAEELHRRGHRVTLFAPGDAGPYDAP